MRAVLIFFSGLLLMQTAVAGGDPANGKKLFATSQCLSCHGTEVFTRADRKVSDLNALESQVRRCDANLPTNWFDDEILDVVAYLNDAYYKFGAAATNAAPAPNAGTQ